MCCKERAVVALAIWAAARLTVWRPQRRSAIGHFMQNPKERRYAWERYRVVDSRTSRTMVVPRSCCSRCNCNKRATFPRFTKGIRIIRMSKGIKPFQVKHLFSEVVCSVKGQGVLGHVGMLITLTAHTHTHSQRLGKRIPLVYWGALTLYSELDLSFSSFAGLTRPSKWLWLCHLTRLLLWLLRGLEVKLPMLS